MLGKPISCRDRDREHKQCYLVAKYKVVPQLVVPVLKQSNYRSHLAMHDVGHIATGLVQLY